MTRITNYPVDATNECVMKLKYSRSSEFNDADMALVQNNDDHAAAAAAVGGVTSVHGVSDAADLAWGHTVADDETAEEGDTGLSVQGTELP
jgi:hypothetical protein